MNLKSIQILFFVFSLFVCSILYAQTEKTIYSPNKKVQLKVFIVNGKAYYKVFYLNKLMLENSPLGLKTNEADFTTQLKFVAEEHNFIDKKYNQDRIKKSEIHYKANQYVYKFENNKGQEINVIFQISDNDIAFRYQLLPFKNTYSCIVNEEITGFKFPDYTTTFLSPMMSAMEGFARTSPSYESGYEADAILTKKTHKKQGYVFPGLFRIGDNGWALISETGVNSSYCASHLSEPSENGIYTVEYPNITQNNGFGSSGAAIALPGFTPWRTVTVGDNLKPIVETTIPFDVVEPLYQASKPYQFGKATWSWIVWQDESMNYEDQKKYIDLAASLGFQYILIDALWDKNIGKQRMETLVKYAASKNVNVFLWYNSNGAFNDAPQGPRNLMNTAIERKKEMRWLQEIGVKGLKVDFFGGDKQETMRLYEDILSDANDYGLMIIFHGCTLPRGWERMYPNFVGSEAVIASEMLIFSESVRKQEAFFATLHPFIRNTVGSMEFGGVLLNKYLTKSNTNNNQRLTTDAFQLATAVLFQNPIQMFALTPNNLQDVPAFEIDFMKEVPTTWDETIYLDGYPGKYCVLARRHNDKWYIAGVNATNVVYNVELSLPMLQGKEVTMYGDDKNSNTFFKPLKINKEGKLKVSIQPNGGLVIK